ncbi:MAG: hypothetical protein IJQ90_00660 [Alphaproteobacteria bacterium]|nr:hypothetical protein [Alphaproteobacteria bacterium]
MKKYFIYTVMFLPVAAMARSYTVFYDVTGNCDDLCLTQPTDGGCCPAPITKVNMASRADADFTGVKVNVAGVDTEIIDSNGYVKSGAASALAAAAASGNSVSKVTGNYECKGTTSKNASGTCVDESGDTEYIDTAGNPVAPSNVSCWRDGVNYCYWRVNITFHDKPTSGATGINVTNGNDGLKLECNGGSGCVKSKDSAQACASQNGAGTCTSINTPHADGYKFRGYYKAPVPNDIITDHSTTNGGAFSVFYPGNLNNAQIGITGHAVVIVSDTPVPIINPGAAIETTAPIDIDVYGGWARDCENDENAICTLKTGIWWNVYDNLGKGDVRYDTGCVNGYVISSGDGTYNPICETEKGEDVTINYVFKDQWGQNVSCNGPAATCALADTYSLTNQSAVQSACGSDYTLKYLITDNKNWHRPGRIVSCSTNEFGSARPVPIVGTVCKNICTIGQHYDDLHATCVAVNQSDSSPTSLGVSMPQYYSNGGYYVVDTYNIENLWDGCQTLECDTGYGFVVDSNGPRCELKQGGDQNFECPGKTDFTLPTNVTLGNPSLTNGTTCTYTIGCNQDYLDLMQNGSAAGGNTITCIGTACSNLQTQINTYSCQLHCPTSGWAMGSVGDDGSTSLTTITYGAPTYDNGICRYNVYCKDSGKTLYHNGTACSSNCQVTCNSYDDCYGVIMGNAPRYTNMHDKFSEWTCDSGGGKGPTDLQPAFTVGDDITEQP